MAHVPGQGDQPEQPAAPRKVDLSPDDVIKDITEHFGQPKGVVVLIGYLGASPQGDQYVRFYFDLGLQSYCDIKASDIVRRERIERADDANASKIFVPADLKLRVVQTVQTQTEVEASFLEGAIVSSHPIEVPTEQQVPQKGGPKHIWITGAKCISVLTTCIDLGSICQPTGRTTPPAPPAAPDSEKK